VVACAPASPAPATPEPLERTQQDAGEGGEAEDRWMHRCVTAPVWDQQTAPAAVFAIGMGNYYPYIAQVHPSVIQGHSRHFLGNA